MVNQTSIVLVIIGVVVLKCIDSQIAPQNPCPNLFQYFQNNAGVFGRMEFPNDLSGFYQLSVNMSLAVYLTDKKNIRLELRTSADDLSRGRSVVYHVYFPIQTVLPKPTRIEFNNRIYCAGPPEEIRPGSGVTNMWATTYYGISRPIRPISPNNVNEIEVIEAVPQFSFNIPANTPEFTLPNVQTPIPTVPSSSSFRPPFQYPPTKPPKVNLDPAPFTSPDRTTKAPNVVDRGPMDNECGLSSITQQLVVHGEKIEDGQFPWMVAIMYSQNLDYKYKCTGTLVSDRHVITAAHCVWYINAPLIPLEELVLVFGKNNIRNWANGGTIRYVQNITGHPEYKQDHDSGDCDIAVLTTSQPVEFQKNIRPVCIWQDEEDLEQIEGKEGTVVGWGMDETGRNFVTEAKKVNLPVVSQGTCLRSDPGFQNITSKRTFCAGKRNGSGPCTGDSGAGFVMNVRGKWILRGVVSTSLREYTTCDLNNYFVFADAAKFKSWIRKAIA